MTTTIYNTVKESPASNRIVKELNASVLTATFPNEDGEYMADLYSSPNSSKKLVYHGTCAPINSLFAGTFLIKLVQN